MSINKKVVTTKDGAVYNELLSLHHLLLREGRTIPEYDMFTYMIDLCQMMFVAFHDMSTRVSDRWKITIQVARFMRKPVFYVAQLAWL
jgi:hypothetical protein